MRPRKFMLLEMCGHIPLQEQFSLTKFGAAGRLGFRFKKNGIRTNNNQKCTKSFPVQSSALMLSTLAIGSVRGQFQTPPANDGQLAPEGSLHVESRRILPLHDGSGRKLVVEQVRAPIVPARSPVVDPAPTLFDPVARAARLAAVLADSKNVRRTVSITGIYYPNGQTFLQWFLPDSAGVWQTYEAWSLTDFRSALYVQEFEVGNTIYDVFAVVHAASKGDERRAMPGPLYFPEGSSGFRLIKGNAGVTQCIEPIAALHEIYRSEGMELTDRWLTAKARQEAEDVWLKANPPPKNDILVQFWPGPNVKLLPSDPSRTGYRRRQ